MWAICIGALVIITITNWVFMWRNPKCKGKLPPGSMGWPLLGETIQFMSCQTTSDLSPFIEGRMKRYGPIFRTSLVGQRIIISTDSELNEFIFKQEGKLFESGWPTSVVEIFGRQCVGSLHIFIFKYIKNLALNLLGHENLKKMLPEVEQATFTKLQRWSSCEDGVELKDSIASLIFDLTAKKLINYDPDSSSENLREYFTAFADGLLSFPLNIPGTAFHKCLQGRKRAMEMLKNMLEERKKGPKKDQRDFFDYVIEDLKKEGTILTEEIVMDLMFALMFASFEATSQAMTSAVKFISDHPLVLKQLTEEHEAILRNRGSDQSGLTWNEYKSMTFTFQIINETTRLANIVPGIFRKALKDFQYKGYTIPEGWAVMVCPPAVHLNPEIYEDPLAFNPWRWEGKELHAGSKNFMAFGGGIRLCVGAEYSKMQMAIFLHCLVTKYSWKVIKGGNIRRAPFLQFPDGFHVQVLPKKEINDGC